MVTYARKKTPGRRFEMQELSFQAAELLEELVASGVELRVAGDEIEFRRNGYRGDDLQERLRENKSSFD